MGPAVGGGVRVSGDRPPAQGATGSSDSQRVFSRPDLCLPLALLSPLPAQGACHVAWWPLRPQPPLRQRGDSEPVGGETSIYLDPRGVLGTRSSEQEVALDFWTAVKARGDTGAFMGQLPESSASLALLSLPGKADDLRFLQLTPVSILSVSSEPSSRGHRAPA